jgi:polyisoprenyl-phosphate glycosyltransferase
VSAIKFSIVSPVFKAEAMVDTLVERIKNSVTPITENFEIILVEDGGQDGSWKKIKENGLNDSRIKGIKLSRNFGQHYAITAGLDHARGEWVVVMDCDLQDQPEEIIKLYNKALEGYDIVLARRHERRDGLLKRLFSWFFYSLLSYLTGTRQDKTVANFGIYNRKVINAICQMRESIRYFPTMVRWVGFSRTSVNVEHAPRAEGKTSYNFRRLLHLAMDIILAFSDKPLRLAVKTGLFISILSIVFAGIVLVQKFSGQIIEPGYASIIISIWFFSGLIISILGVTGLYIGKIFEGVKNRPIYIVTETVNP